MNQPLVFVCGIIAVQLAFLGIMAFCLKTWVKRQSDQLKSRYKISSCFVIAAEVLIVVSLIFTLTDEKMPSGSMGAAIGVPVLLLAFSILARAELKKKLRARDHAN